LHTLTNEGFFLSPSGVLIPVKGTHIATVIFCPEAFGLSREEVDAVYKAHGEIDYYEGKARDEILRSVLQRSWIRLRRHRERWSVQSDRLDELTQERVRAWAAQVLCGIGGYIEEDRYIEIVMEGVGDNCRHRASLGEWARPLVAERPMEVDYCSIEAYAEMQEDG
jgi:hypothetical protein